MRKEPWRGYSLVRCQPLKHRGLGVIHVNTVGCETHEQNSRGCETSCGESRKIVPICRCLIDSTLLQSIFRHVAGQIGTQDRLKVVTLKSWDCTLKQLPCRVVNTVEPTVIGEYNVYLDNELKNRGEVLAAVKSRELHSLGGVFVCL